MSDNFLFPSESLIVRTALGRTLTNPGADMLVGPGPAAIATGVTVALTAIQWLRLAAASTSAGPGGCRLADTTYVQRIATVGGLAPAAADCTSATAGTRPEIPYTADYRFWKAA